MRDGGAEEASCADASPSVISPPCRELTEPAMALRASIRVSRPTEIRVAGVASCGTNFQYQQYNCVRTTTTNENRPPFVEALSSCTVSAGHAQRPWENIMHRRNAVGQAGAGSCSSKRTVTFQSAHAVRRAWPRTRGASPQ